MKAIILAGGEGTRLRPLSMNKPKPMIRLFDRPLLEHIVLLLRQCGFTELCMTLHYLPQVIMEHFGDGSDLGVSIEYRIEAQAAGTAGSVLACRDFVGNDDVLVISGDAACSYDLRAMMEKHRLSGADTTILVRRSDTASEFGLVLAEEDGQIKGFVEKPGPERVVSDLINTGIYVLSPSVLAEIPEGRSADFGGEVFPKMLRLHRRLRIWEAEGYWNDVGSCEAYRMTCRDVLDGRFPLPIPQGRKAEVSGPCWISPEADVAPGSRLGPYAVIGGGSVVRGGCRVSGSILDGAFLEAGCTVEDSILAQGVRLGREVQLRSGCVLSEGVTAGAGCLLLEGVRVWPGVTLPAGSVLGEDQLHGPGVRPLRFQTGGLILGEDELELTPEKLLRMGRGCPADRVGAAAGDGGYARLLAEAFLIGAGSAGKRTFFMDTALPAAAAAMTAIYDLEESLFCRREGSRTVIRFFDRDSLPLPRKDQRKLETALNAAAGAFPSERSRGFELLTGTEEAFLSAILRSCGGLDGRKLACSNDLLRSGLLRAGAEIVPPSDGVPELRLSGDGFTLSAVDEKGRVWPWNMLLCGMAAAELRCGADAVALPYDAPYLAERIAEDENGTVYRLERDGEDARKLWREAPWCRDGMTLALRLFSRLHELGGPLRLADFMDTLPEYHSREQVIKLDSADTTVLRMLSQDRDAETVNGVLLRQGEATASVRRHGIGELRILTESTSMEAAEEFCESLRRRIQKLDGKEQG